MTANKTKYLTDKLSKLSKAPRSSALSNMEEIKKYKELLDMGIITNEEFEVKKKELLGF